MIVEFFLWLRQNAQHDRLKRLEHQKRRLEDKISRLEASQAKLDTQKDRSKRDGQRSE